MLTPANPALYEVAMLISAILFAFMAGMLFYRMRLAVEASAAGQRPRLPWADAIMAYVGLPTLAVGGLLLPLMGVMLETDMLQHIVVALTGFGIVVAAFYPSAVLWHHDLSVGWGKAPEGQPRTTAGEAFMVVVAVVVAIAWAVSTLR